MNTHDFTIEKYNDLIYRKNMPSILFIVHSNSNMSRTIIINEKIKIDGVIAPYFIAKENGYGIDYFMLLDMGNEVDPELIFLFNRPLSSERLKQISINKVSPSNINRGEMMSSVIEPEITYL